MATRRLTQTDTKVPSNKVLNRSASQTIGINKHAVTELALYGSQGRIDALFRETHSALVRLGLVGTKARALRRVPKGSGAEPAIHDVRRWLEAIDTTEAYADDRLWLMRLHKTLAVRVDPAVKAEVTKR
jgi:hypothetical protein